MEVVVRAALTAWLVGLVQRAKGDRGLENSSRNLRRALIQRQQSDRRPSTRRGLRLETDVRRRCPQIFQPPLRPPSRFLVAQMRNRYLPTFLANGIRDRRHLQVRVLPSRLAPVPPIQRGT